VKFERLPELYLPKNLSYMAAELITPVLDKAMTMIKKSKAKNIAFSTPLPFLAKVIVDRTKAKMNVKSPPLEKVR